MLHKCANPDCVRPFRRLTEGKLFLIEIGGSCPPGQTVARWDGTTPSPHRTLLALRAVRLRADAVFRQVARHGDGAVAGSGTKKTGGRAEHSNRRKCSGPSGMLSVKACVGGDSV